MPKKGTGNQEKATGQERAFVESYIGYCHSKDTSSERTQAKKRQYAYSLIAVMHDMGKDLFTATYEDFSKIPGRLKNPAGKPVTQNTRQSYVSTLKAMVSYMEGTGHDIAGIRKLFTDIPAGSPSKHNKHVLEPEEWLKVLNAPMSAKERAYIAMLYDGYHRPTEPLTLKWSDLKINDNGAVQYDITFKTPFKRTIVQKPDCTALLEAWRRECGYNYGDDVFIFPSTGGAKYTSRGFSADLFEKIEKATGIVLVPSCIRNTSISHDVDNEMSIQYICLRAWGEPFNDMINLYVTAHSAKLQTNAQATANGRQGQKIEQMKPKELKTLKECPSCHKPNAMAGTFCVYCGANMNGQQMGAMQELQKQFDEQKKQFDELKKMVELITKTEPKH